MEKHYATEEKEVCSDCENCEMKTNRERRRKSAAKIRMAEVGARANDERSIIIGRRALHSFTQCEPT